MEYSEEIQLTDLFSSGNEQKRHTILLASLILAAFGPYLFGPVRVEQLTVYAFTPLAALNLSRLPTWSYKFLIAWIWTILIATISVLFPHTGPMPAEPASLLAGYDTLLLPLAVMVIAWVFVPPDTARDVLTNLSRVIVLASAANASLAIVSTVIPLNAVLRPFWGREGVVGTVAESAQTMGRFTGVFAQPAEAGLVYSIAAVLAVWAFAARRSYVYVLLGVITLGGILSVSKVFILIGLPIALILFFSLTRGVERMFGISVLAISASAVWALGLLQAWDGFSYFTRLFARPTGMSPVEFYTAGRWNSDAPMFMFLEQVLDSSPWLGFGARGLRASYDSQWTESLVMGGVVGGAGVITILALLYAQFQRIVDRDTRRLSFAFLATIIGASFGIPALTANRAATILWIVAALLVAIANSPANEAQDEPAGKSL